MVTAPLQPIIALTLVPVAATLIGDAIAVWRAPGKRVRSLIQHFAAGVVLAAVAGELMPEMTKAHQPLGVVAGFILGIALMLGVKLAAKRLEGGHVGAGARKTGLLAAVGIDIFVDGLLIGIGFAAGARVGTLLVIALSIELTFLGLSVATSLLEAGYSRARAFLSVAALSCLVSVGTITGVLLLGGISGLTLEIVLSFGAAALMYLVVEELLTEAHQVEETPLITTSFFAGFVVLYLLELMA